MSRIVRSAICCAVWMAASPVWAQEGPPAAESSNVGEVSVLHQGDDQTLAVYAARSTPAAVLARLVEDMLGENDDLRLEAEPHHNSLVVYGPSEAVGVILKTLKTLDRPRAKVQLRLWAVGIPCERLEEVTQVLSAELSADDVGARLQQAQSDGQLKVLDHVALTTLAGQPAAVQVGQILPVATGEQQTQHGKSRSFSMNNFGLMTNLNADVAGDQVTVQLTYEKSEPRRVEHDDSSQNEFTPDGTVTRQTSLTTTLRNGSASLLSGGPLPGVEGCAQWRLILSVTAVSP